MCYLIHYLCYLLIILTRLYHQPDICTWVVFFRFSVLFDLWLCAVVRVFFYNSIKKYTNINTKKSKYLQIFENIEKIFEQDKKIIVKEKVKKKIWWKLFGKVICDFIYQLIPENFVILLQILLLCCKFYNFVANFVQNRSDGWIKLFWNYFFLVRKLYFANIKLSNCQECCLENIVLKVICSCNMIYKDIFEDVIGILFVFDKFSKQFFEDDFAGG